MATAANVVRVTIDDVRKVSAVIDSGAGRMPRNDLASDEQCRRPRRGLAAVSAATPIQPGRIEVVANVTLTAEVAPR
jgi:hypothetical protein